MTVRQEGFHDQVSEELYPEIPRKNAIAKSLLSLEDMDIGEAYVTAKIANRHGDIVKMNIASGTPRISLNETLVNLKGQRPSTAYLLTSSKEGKILVRKLPVVGFSDWLLIFEDTLFVQAVEGGCQEIEMFLT